MPAFGLSALAFASMTAHSQVATLPPVTVTVTRFQEDASRLAFGVSVLTADKIRDSGATTVNDALMKLLGIPGRQDFYGGNDYQLDLRGFGSTSDSNQIVIVDGVRISEADLGGTRLSGIPIDSVDTIEVIRGSGAAVLYGEGGTGGAIVITTKAASGKPRKNSGQGYLAMGSHSLLDGRGNATLVSGGLSLDVSLNQRSTDGHRRNFHSSTEGRSLAAQWHKDWLRFGARHAQDKLETGLPGALTTAQYDADPKFTNRPTDRAHIANQRNGVFANATFGNWQIALDAGQRDKALESHTSFAYAYDIEATNRSARVRHSAPIGAFTNTLAAGLDIDEWTRLDLFGTRAEQESKAVYLKDDFVLPGGTLISVGARRQKLAKTNTSSPAASIDRSIDAWDFGMVHPLWSSASAYWRVGRSFRLPNADEFSYTSPGINLQPQTSRDIDLGLRMGWATGKSDLRLYRSALRNEIGFDPVAADPFGGTFGANVNFDATLRHGIELEMLQQLSRDWEVHFNAASLQAKFTQGPNDGKRVALTPRYTASAGVDWKVLPGHKLGALVNTVSSRSPDFGNTCTMPAYTLGSLRYAFSTEQVELGLGVNNVTDKKYYTQAYGCASGVPTSIYPEAGRTVTLSVRVSL